jgi:hypothetical protein
MLMFVWWFFFGGWLGGIYWWLGHLYIMRSSYHGQGDA